MNPWNPPAGIGNDHGSAPEKGQSLEEHVRKTWAWVLSGRLSEDVFGMMLPPPEPLQGPSEQLDLLNGPDLLGRTQSPEEMRPNFVDIWDLGALGKALDMHDSRNLRNPVHDSDASRPISNGTASLVARDDRKRGKIHMQVRDPSATFRPTTVLVECPLKCYRHLSPAVQLVSFADRNSPENTTLQQIFQDIGSMNAVIPSQYTASNIEALKLAAGQKPSMAALAMAKQSVRVKYDVQTDSEDTMHNRSVALIGYYTTEL